MEITLITDQYGSFLSKIPSNPYRAGMDLSLIKDLFQGHDIQITIKKYSEIQFFEDYKSKIFIYTSIEDPKGSYRSYMDDVLYGLEFSGAILLPSYKCFKAHENKVFMEILRNLLFKKNQDIISYKLGSYSDFKNVLSQIQLPVVLKKSSGSASKGVYLSKTTYQLKKTVKKISNTHDFISIIKDSLLFLKKKLNKIEYINRVSLYRKKFVIQNYIENLPSDFKVLIFGKRYYVLNRINRSSDFRASGSGHFIKSNENDIPIELLNSCEKWFMAFDVPCASFDVAITKDRTFLIEFQFISFGTYTQTSAECYYQKRAGIWESEKNNIPLEKAYVDSVAEYLKSKNLK